jgi:hypothetical protein
VQQAAGVTELGRSDFLPSINDLLAIYAAAMSADPDELPSRRAIVRVNDSGSR